MARGWEVLALPSEWAGLPPPPPQECLQRFGDSLQEMVNYHMVSAAGPAGGPSSFLAPLSRCPAVPGQAAPLAPRRPRPAWTALRAGSEEAELAPGEAVFQLF